MEGLRIFLTFLFWIFVIFFIIAGIMFGFVEVINWIKAQW